MFRIDNEQCSLLNDRHQTKVNERSEMENETEWINTIVGDSDSHEDEEKVWQNETENRRLKIKNKRHFVIEHYFGCD